VICCRPFRLAVPKYPDHSSVSTSRSSNRTCGSPASGSRTGITLAHATPSAVPEHFAKFNRLPNLRVLTASGVGPELRPLSSTGVTRLPRYYRPLRHPKAPDPSLTGDRLLISEHAVGFPVLRALSLCTCCRQIPRRGGWDHRSALASPTLSAFPDSGSGSARASSFSRPARRLLTLRPVHSPRHRIS